ncbi:acyl-CoA thioesterase II [Phaeodactylibacter luteus]|uniref:Acyl-CoA thioesterase 2 n=1 Tax=Phaeodactylibacter luteus TaxID=1564516 RepID=A0A5C6RM41_9BACT|nr:acyl-CoA thioesterase II [Phaeodactylibacter luteus]TXB63024.1 acyl-CoA thioesterase II [Phaeodactylibacter luteus]
MNDIQALLSLLDLEPIEENLFRGQSRSVGSGRVFGGQVLAQALQSAMRTVPEDRVVHSLHAYFILPGDVAHPIIFEVDRIRDGGSFTTRRVKAIQKGRAIFNMSASFQKEQVGFDHQLSMPNVKPPEGLMSWDELVAQYGGQLPEGIRRFLEVSHPIEFRPVERVHPMLSGKQQPLRHVWMRSKGEMPPARRAHQAVLAYASDYNLLTTALLPHGDLAAQTQVQLASLDHAMWFHRPFRADEWLLYAIDSPSASNARGFTRGSIFNQQGQLVASVVQEGLIRPVGA